MRVMSALTIYSNCLAQRAQKQGRPCRRQICPWFHPVPVVSIPQSNCTTFPESPPAAAPSHRNFSIALPWWSASQSQTNLRARVGCRTRTARRELPTTKLLLVLTAADTHALAIAQNPAVLMLANVTLQKLFCAAADQPCTLHIVTFVRKQMTLVNQDHSGSGRARPLMMGLCIASRTAYATCRVC